MDEFVVKDNKKLRRGFTTGTCAAAAACGAAQILLSQGAVIPQSISILTPKGIKVNIPIEETEQGDGWVKCAVRKDSGDDPDITNGVLVYAKVMLAEGQIGSIEIVGGIGIGTVTKPGLACPPGEPAINPTPRKMIRDEVHKVAQMMDYHGALSVEISIPKGVELAAKTFNPKLGIEGGISVLGTSGIVEPMSEQALIDTIKVELNMKKAEGISRLVITPGNYGEAFLKEKERLAYAPYVKCSNFIGDTMDHVKDCEFEGVLLAGHIGKLIKVAAGAMNTHSKYGDGRMETLAAYAKRYGAEAAVTAKILSAVTTEEGVALLKEFSEKLIGDIMQGLAEKVKENLRSRVGDALEIEVILYSNQHGFLGETQGVNRWLDEAEKGWRK